MPPDRARDRAAEDGPRGVVEVSVTSWLGSRVKLRFDRLHIENQMPMPDEGA